MRDWVETVKYAAIVLACLPIAIAATIGTGTLIYLIFVWSPLAILPAMIALGLTILMWLAVWLFIGDMRDA